MNFQTLTFLTAKSFYSRLRQPPEIAIHDYLTLVGKNFESAAFGKNIFIFLGRKSSSLLAFKTERNLGYLLISISFFDNVVLNFEYIENRVDAFKLSDIFAKCASSRAVT